MAEHLTTEQLRQRFNAMHGATYNPTTGQTEPTYATGADLQAIGLQLVDCLEGIEERIRRLEGGEA